MSPMNVSLWGLYLCYMHNLDSHWLVFTFTKASKAKLHETIAETEEEVQICARELFAIVDGISKYKEYIS